MYLANNFINILTLLEENFNDSDKIIQIEPEEYNILTLPTTYCVKVTKVVAILFLK